MSEKEGTNLPIVATLTGFATLFIGIGIGRFGYPPLIPAIINAKWFTVSQADYLGAANLGGYILGSAFAARINKYIPAVTLIRLALISAILSFMLCAFPFSFRLYFLLRLLSGVAGGFLMIMVVPTIFKHTTTRKKGILSGIIFSGVGLGIAFSGTIIPFLLKRGLTFTWLIFSLVSFLLMILSWKGWPKGSNEKHEIEIAPKQRGRHSIGSRPIILLLISYACNAVGFVPHTVFWVDFISRGLGMGIYVGTRFWVLLGVSAAIGPVIIGYLADKIGFAKSIRMSLIIKGIGVLMPIVSTATWSLAISSIFVGSFALGISSLAAGRVTELVFPDMQKKVWSWMTIAFSITHASTAFILSYVFSITRSYNLLFEIGAITLIIGSIVDYLSSLSQNS